MPVVPALGDEPSEAALERGASALKAGEPIVLPTDTVYGLAVHARRHEATTRLFELKHRPADVALAVLVGSVEQAVELADELPEAARRLMDAFWPGGLTIVVPRRPGLDLDLGGVEDGTIGLRLPAHPLPVTLARMVGPLATTSANRHGEATPETAVEVAEQLGEDLLVLDGGPCAGAPSTVVSCHHGEVRILREGRVPAAEVEAVAG